MMMMMMKKRETRNKKYGWMDEDQNLIGCLYTLLLVLSFLFLPWKDFGFSSLFSKKYFFPFCIHSD